MLCRYVGRRAREKKDPTNPFRQTADFLSKADLTFINLESPFSDKGRRAEHGLVFKAEPEMIEGLVLAGVDVVSTANNHTRDSRSRGVEYTLDWLRQHSIQPVGTGKTAEKAHEGVVVIRNGIRFGFLAYTYDQSNGNWKDVDDRIAMTDPPEVMVRDVAALKKKADVVIVSMHNGIEYQRKPNKGQIDFARRAIDAGAALVIGHHPHVTQTVENYKDGVIFYSLGNFVFDQFWSRRTQEGEIAEAIFEDKRLVKTRTIPVKVGRDGPYFPKPSGQ